jgi:hypothetical protein
MAKLSFDCSCGEAHSGLTPTALNWLLGRVYSGELQTVSAQGVQTSCAVTALRDLWETE